jgi:hypothetical protein
VWRTPGADHLAARYARERKLRLEFIANRSAEVIGKLSANILVVFDGGGKESAELVKRAHADGIPVQIVDVRDFVVPARL